MKVSGDVEALRAYLKSTSEDAPMNGEAAADSIAACWSYAEDIALSMPESTPDFRELLLKKGKDQIEKRKIFLLGSGTHTV